MLRTPLLTRSRCTSDTSPDAVTIHLKHLSWRGHDTPRTPRGGLCSRWVGCVCNRRHGVRPLSEGQWRRVTHCHFFQGGVVTTQRAMSASRWTPMHSMDHNWLTEKLDRERQANRVLDSVVDIRKPPHATPRRQRQDIDARTPPPRSNAPVEPHRSTWSMWNQPAQRARVYPRGTPKVSPRVLICGKYCRGQRGIGPRNARFCVMQRNARLSARNARLNARLPRVLHR